MIAWPTLGTRVTLRYRRPPGSVPPLTDAVGHLLAFDPIVRVQTKSGAVIETAPNNVVALRVLTDAPVRTADIRDLERVASGPGTWLEGWLLRDQGITPYADSAVPLDISAHSSTIPAIVDWYTDRGLTPRLAIPDRLLVPPPGLECELTEQVWVCRATESFLCIPDTDPTAAAHAQGYRFHHRRRYLLPLHRPLD